MEDSIFSKIIRGEIPCHKIHEDDKTLAFMDIDPIQPGQVVVVPKAQVDHLWDVNDDDYQAVMATVREVARRLRNEFTDKPRVAIIVEGFEVPHAHVKVFPVSSGDDVRVHPTHAEPDHQALADMAKKLAWE